MPPRIKQSGRR